MNAATEEWTGTTTRLNAIATALAKAQASFEPIRRDKTVTVRTKAGGQYSFSYAPLEAILRAVQPALAQEGLALSQNIVTDNSVEYLETALHLGAQTLVSRVKVLVSEPGPQAYGSALTYARRYGITLLLCVCADDDDDGNAAEGNETHVDRNNGELSFPRGTLTPEKNKQYLPKVVAAIDKEDTTALRKLVSELNEGEQRGLWFFLSHKQKTAAREMLQKMVQPGMLTASGYVAKFREALESGVDGRIAELHQECNSSTQLYLEVSTLLTVPERKRINEAIARAHA